MDAPADKPIARWLRASRESQRMEDPDGNSVAWTHKHLLARMAEIGWAPPHSNYSKYESGKATPKPTTLGKFVRFWKTYGIDAPDLSPARPPAPEPTLAAVLSDLVVELGEGRRERTRLVEQVADLRLVVKRLVELVPGAAEELHVLDGTTE